MDALALHIESAERVLAKAAEALADMKANQGNHARVGNLARDGVSLAGELQDAMDAAFSLAAEREFAQQDAEREAREAGQRFVQGHVDNIVTINSLKRVTETPRLYAVGSQDGAA